VLPEGYRIEDLSQDHTARIAAAYRRNRAHLAPWEPIREETFYTEEGQGSVVAGQLAGVRQGQLAAWVVLRGDQVVARVNLNSIVMGVFRSGSLGYWVDAEQQGRGLATAAVQHACGYADGRGLHRVEAGTLLHNVASQRVLERCGFHFFGTAPSYLFIAGAWQDHRLYQRILNDRPL
jgi:[ribosomal protein S5]-alanine N-acetyltransferase